MTEILIIWQACQHFRSTSSAENLREIRGKKISVGFGVYLGRIMDPSLYLALILRPQGDQ